jgi:hypothetical protein
MEAQLLFVEKTRGNYWQGEFICSSLALAVYEKE